MFSMVGGSTHWTWARFAPSTLLCITFRLHTLRPRAKVRSDAVNVTKIAVQPPKQRMRLQEVRVAHARCWDGFAAYGMAVLRGCSGRAALDHACLFYWLSFVKFGKPRV